MARTFQTFRLKEYLETYKEELIQTVEDQMEEIVSEALEGMQDAIESAETPTGQHRAEVDGGHPGRIDSGDMQSDVKGEIEREGDTVVGRWGFLDDPEDYYIAQDAGFEHYKSGKFIQGFNGLNQTFAKAMDRAAAYWRRG